MNFEEFKEYVLSYNDVSKVHYILNVRKTDQIQYLIRYNDSNIHYNQWFESSDFNCDKKILNFNEEKATSTIVSNLMPESFPNEPAEFSPDDTNKFIIIW